jgi:hypothetical protein
LPVDRSEETEANETSGGIGGKRDWRVVLEENKRLDCLGCRKRETVRVEGRQGKEKEEDKCKVGDGEEAIAVKGKVTATWASNKARQAESHGPADDPWARALLLLFLYFCCLRLFSRKGKKGGVLYLH